MGKLRSCTKYGCIHIRIGGFSHRCDFQWKVDIDNENKCIWYINKKKFKIIIQIRWEIKYKQSKNNKPDKQDKGACEHHWRL